VLFGSGLPGFAGAFRAISVDGAEATVGSPVRTIAVDREFFSALEMPVAAGRPFDSGDLGTDGSVAIVDESFARQVFGRESPIGRRVQPRLSSRPQGPEVTIVGVVPDLGGDVGGSDGRLGILYRLARPGEVHPLELGVLVAGDPEAFAPQLQQITATLSPSLRLTRVQSLDAFGEDERRSYRMVLAALGLVSSIALLLSTVGIHSLMSFAVSQRTREIGIRTALGAGPRRIVVSIFSRAVAQLCAGVVLGGAVALAFPTAL
jgi:putative ABC transport system permease protein